jgi:hypothetical protein
MFLFPLQLSLTIDWISLDMLCVVRNPGTSSIHIGGLTEKNITIRSADVDCDFALPWFSASHLRNDTGLHEIAPGSQLEFRGNILEQFEFPRAGHYIAFAVYDSVGFNRFGGPRHEPLSYLARVDPARALSDETQFEVNAEQLDLNRQLIAERRRSFLGGATTSNKMTT